MPTEPLEALVCYFALMLSSHILHLVMVKQGAQFLCNSFLLEQVYFFLWCAMLPQITYSQFWALWILRNVKTLRAKENAGMGVFKVQLSLRCKDLVFEILFN